MEIKGTCYINPYTLQLTSKRITNVENRRELCEFMRNETLFTPISRKDLMNGVGKSSDSAAKFAAQEAYERQMAASANKTYQFADERMKKRIAHLSDYYLSTVPESVKAAWQETLEETGVNPFFDGSSTLAQLAVEQDFMTGGNDNIFGNTVEDSINAVKKILDRVKNPLGKLTADRADFLEREKGFYSTLLKKVEKCGSDMA